jgi:hypothetical protein
MVVRLLKSDLWKIQNYFWAVFTGNRAALPEFGTVLPRFSKWGQSSLPKVHKEPEYVESRRTDIRNHPIRLQVGFRAVLLTHRRTGKLKPCCN